jgi:hypothetical protein
MNMHRLPRSRAGWPLLALLALAATAAPARAASPSKAELDQAIARHKAEVAACNRGETNQSRSDCIRDADGALRAVRNGAMDSEDTAYKRNQRERCEPLPEAQRKDCLARMRGQGTVSGTVADGGIYRELVTREVGPVPTPMATTPMPVAPAASSPPPVPSAPASGPR